MAKRAKAAGLRGVSASLMRAHQDLEKALLLDTAPMAMAAASGTRRYGYENILGVGIGEKVSEGAETGEPCVVVYVMAKAPRRDVDSEAMVPQVVDGVATDVVAVGELVPQPYRGRYRPAPGGVSIGHFRITAGTLGCMVRRGTQRFILSNNHVLANSNAAKVGDAILQPGVADGGRNPADQIARLAQFVPIRFGGTAPNLVDAAIAKPMRPDLVIPRNIWYGTIGAGIVAPSMNLLVKKAGRTTQRTRGRISGVNATVRVNYGTSGMALFRNQILIVSLNSSPFSQGGDSGSLIVTDAGNRPVGLLFAGSASHTIASPIQSVLTALNVQIQP
jgi:hypothetical protein